MIRRWLGTKPCSTTCLCKHFVGSQGDAEEDESGDETDDANVCLTCGLDTDPEKLMRCSKCSTAGNGMGVFHYDCLKVPLDAKPSGEVRTYMKRLDCCDGPATETASVPF